MSPEHTIRTRRRPAGPALTFVIYERKTGAIKSVHHVVSAPARADAVLTPGKQRAAAATLNAAVIRRTASMAGVRPGRLAVLRLRQSFKGTLAGLRVDHARGRLARGPRTGEAELSSLITLRRRPRR